MINACDLPHVSYSTEQCAYISYDGGGVLKGYNDTLNQWNKYTMIQWYNDTMKQWYKDTMKQGYNDTMIQ